MSVRDPLPDTLPALLARTVAAYGERPAVTEGDQTLSWRDFAEGVANFDLPIAPGDRVALWLPNGIRYLTAIFAVAARGGVSVHVNARFGAAEVDALLARTRPAALLAATDNPVLTQLSERPTAAPAQRATPVSVVPDDDCLIYTTGGTTALPKLVVHPQRSIAAHAQAVAARIGLNAADAAYLGIVPLSGTFGNVGAMAAVAAGAHIVLCPAFEPADAADLLRRHGVTHSLGDDRTLARLAAAGAGPLRFFGTAAFGADAEPAFAAGRVAGLSPHAIYGSSEAQALFATGAGPAVVPVSPAARARVIDDELLIAGPSLFDRYLDDPATTAAARTEGFFRTGDRARVEGDGFVFEGRMGDVLRLGGFLVAPQEIEAFLASQPGVAEVQVVGVDTARGPKAFAFARPADGFSEPALLAACTARLARYKVPVRIAALDAFPTSTGPNGPKISRAELRRLAAEQLAAAPDERNVA